MIVFFRARTQFTDPITRDFWRKLRNYADPFINITAVGGSRNGHFSGSLELEDLNEESMAYEITAALVDKIEVLSRVGVSHIEFDEITVGVV